MAFVYNDDWAMIEYEWFIYKGTKYYKNQILVNIKGDLYSIRLIEMSKVKFKMYLDDVKTHKSKIIECDINLIDTVIDNVVSVHIPIETQESPVYEHPDAMSAITGFIWYGIIMVGGLIFKDWFVIWIVASIIFWPWYIKKPKFKK